VRLSRFFSRRAQRQYVVDAFRERGLNLQDAERCAGEVIFSARTGSPLPLFVRELVRRGKEDIAE
jgi:hypothetical protein